MERRRGSMAREAAEDRGLGRTERRGGGRPIERTFASQIAYLTPTGRRWSARILLGSPHRPGELLLAGCELLENVAVGRLTGPQIPPFALERLALLLVASCAFACGVGRRCGGAGRGPENRRGERRNAEANEPFARAMLESDLALEVGLLLEELPSRLVQATRLFAELFVFGSKRQEQTLWLRLAPGGQAEPRLEPRSDSCLGDYLRGAPLPTSVGLAPLTTLGERMNDRLRWSLSLTALLVACGNTPVEPERTIPAAGEGPFAAVAVAPEARYLVDPESGAVLTDVPPAILADLNAQLAAAGRSDSVANLGQLYDLDTGHVRDERKATAASTTLQAAVRGGGR